ncbi:uncharacterized protein N7458_009087 [Penicillium daleae]|uniref:Hydrophobin n=1 Tax=Penicillium daleae TaxID=63821 RepID=A0AAD6FYK4_9EURO|nr:uncharacterized protein N7458_009087 [Penicillium daleae]KAJ5438089.1 hypothetical protein N7458_009087 [Penicillium daleae]
MLVKNIIAAFALAGLATATPAENIQARANSGTCGTATNPLTSHAWCCVSALPLNIFFIQGVGSNCVQAIHGAGNTFTCPTSGNTLTRQSFLCCGNNQIPSTGATPNVVCTA